MPGPKHDTVRSASRPRSRSGRIGAPATTVVSDAAICQFLDANGVGEHAASWVAAQQLELITVKQLRAAGVGRGIVRMRRRQGTLHLVHQGVYHLGTNVMLPGANELAAVLACGEGARVRRRSAVALFGLSDPWEGEAEVLVVGRNCRRAGIDVARVPRLDPIDSGTQDGIPIVAPALALLDFAGVATGDELERAITEAYALKLVTETQLRDVIDRHCHRTGVAALRAELDRAGGPMWTASKAERVMKALLREADLPMPQTRVGVAGYPADFLWPQFRLIVETDGYQYHGHRYAFERDRRRDQAHIGAGYRVIRFTWRQLEDEPLRVIGVIAMAIGATR
jgi:very-short-patch-repair endonuclease